MDSNYTNLKENKKIFAIDNIENRIIKDFSKINNEEIDEVPLGFFIESIYRYYSDYLNHHLKNVDLTPKQIYILLILSNENNLNQESIASVLNSNEVTTAREINHLEKNEFIERETDSNDKRKKIVLLTDKGKKLVNIITKFSNISEENLNEYISPEELHILRILLKKLLLSVNEQLLKPSFSNDEKY